MREQDLFRSLVAQSMLLWQEFDNTDNDVGRVAEEAADWLGRTGGLWVPDE